MRSCAENMLATYARYPRYPQAESPRIRLVRLGFRDSFITWPRRSGGNEGTVRYHGPSRTGLLPHQAWRQRREGRAADEAAARRKLRACPDAKADAAGFVKRPQGRAGLRAGSIPKTKERLRPISRPAESGIFGSAHRQPAKRRNFGFDGCRADTGPGSVCENGNGKASARQLPGGAAAETPRRPKDRTTRLRPRRSNPRED